MIYIKYCSGEVWKEIMICHTDGQLLYLYIMKNTYTSKAMVEGSHL